ncbi:MAG: chemotaxis protein CheX [Myxococcales bacterium]|nr:chemotaxis protein CheX [Myxococcales bacterium]
MAEHPAVDVGLVAQRILEEAAFIFAEPAEDDAPLESPTINAQLDFRGPSNGRLLLRASPEFAVLLAANLLGVEPDEPDALTRRQGAVGEILNMIAGALMETLFGDEVTVHLGIPEIDAGLRPSATPAANRTVLLTEEEFPVEISLYWTA